MDQSIPGTPEEFNKMCSDAFSGWEAGILAGHKLTHINFGVKKVLFKSVFSLNGAIPEDRFYGLL